ncbi:MAG: TolC family protein [Bdellovibrionaceae bacterium]|nr:TolC family protein [Pseudobdellovibrionaceae bacterium]
MRKSSFARIVLMGCSSVALGAALVPSTTQKITFKDAIEMVVQKSPTLNKSKIEVELRDLEYQNASSAFLPSLDFTTNHGLRDNRPSIYNNIYGSDLNLQLTENLYDNGISSTKYESAKIQKEIAYFNYQNERDKIVLELALRYMHYSLAKSLADVQQQQFNIVNKQYQSVFNQYQQGVKTRRDYLRFKTELRRAEIDLQASVVNTEKYRLELMSLLGFEMTGPLDKPFDFIPIEIKKESIALIPAQEPNLVQHPRYRIADLQKKVYENDVYIIKRSYWPELALNASATYHSGDYAADNVRLTDNQTTSWNVLLTMKFNVWDWGLRRRNISIAAVRKTQAENTIAADLNDFSSENKKLMLDLQQSSKKYSLAQELLDLENMSFQFLDSEYRSGKSSYLDIIVGLRDLLSAKVQMYTSYYDLRGQLLKYRYHEGTLYEFILKN